MALEEERIKQMENMLEEDDDEEGDDGDEEESNLNKSQASVMTGRPMSGKEARQQR